MGWDSCRVQCVIPISGRQWGGMGQLSCSVCNINIWETVGWDGKDTEGAELVTGEKGLGWRLQMGFKQAVCSVVIGQCSDGEREIC